jgi:hypothetical protein
MYFAADGSGAFPVQSNDPVKELLLEPLYSSVVAVFKAERRTWFRCAVEIVKRSKPYVVSVCFDTTLSLVQHWNPLLKHGSVVRLPAQVPSSGGLPPPVRVVRSSGVVFDERMHSRMAVIVGVRANQLYRLKFVDEVAYPLSTEELAGLEVLTEEALSGEYQLPYVRSSPLNRRQTLRDVSERCLLNASRYIDTTGGDSGFKFREATKFKLVNVFRQLCLYDQSELELKVYGVEAFDWLEITSAHETRWTIVVGVRGDALWKLDSKDLGVLALHVRLVPHRGSEVAERYASEFRGFAGGMEETVPVTSMFNHCKTHDDLVQHYSVKPIGVAKMPMFTG